MPDPHNLHVIVMGSQNVGKTSLIRNYWHKPFLEESRICVEAKYYTKNVCSSDGWKVRLTVTDVCGYEAFRDLNKKELKKTQVVVICYDVTEAESWEGALKCLKDTFNEHVRVYFCGTKLDLISHDHPRIINAEIVKATARHINGRIIETSSKTPKSTEPLFRSIVDDYVKSFPEYQKWRQSYKGKLRNVFRFRYLREKYHR